MVKTSKCLKLLDNYYYERIFDRYTGISQCDLTPKDEPSEVPDIEDDYTPLDPTYLPPGLEEDKPNKFSNEKEAEGLEEEVSIIVCLLSFIDW